MPIRAVVILICITPVIASCGPSVPPLHHTYSSPSVLANAVLVALEQRNWAALRDAVVSEREFRDHVWPELPASRPERNLAFWYVWGDLRRKSDAALRDTMIRQGGRHYNLIDIQFLRGTTRYNTYFVHRETELTVTDASGAESRLRLFGSVLEKDDRFKVFSYVVD
jgi:hypothetical protein